MSIKNPANYTQLEYLMDNPQKFSNSKEVINFLSESFPACFSVTGDAKPLKIGIFQDLAQRLEEEERVSKTLLRSSLRHYTNSWRYLHSVKEGAFRVDLDGQQAAPIEKEHADHAQAQLEESKAKVAEKRKAQNAAKPGAKKSYKSKTVPAFKSSPKGTNQDNVKPKAKLPPPEKLSAEQLVAGTSVTVKIGKSPMPATITDVSKDGVQVQLDTGMVVKVQVDNLRLARSKR
ncbi:MAG: RNA chaperone ProQ [Alteromonadaceae bacterium]|nr:RNA chaperone ProQ [Alteromonadaceae bacterium]GAC25841.1 ProP effector [Paraglaciecola mesophila KMM 241]